MSSMTPKLHDSGRVMYVVISLLAMMLLAGCQLPFMSSHTPNSIPTPDSRRTTYVNSGFAYRLVYPTQWTLASISNSSAVMVSVVDNPAFPDPVILQISCFANKAQLDPESWWRQHQPPNGVESGRGAMRLRSGVVAYKAVGKIDRAYTLYVVTKASKACDIYVSQFDASNTAIANTAANTFTWV